MCVSHCYSVSAVVTMCQQLLQCVSTSVSTGVFAARHVVEKEKDIKRAMEFQRECDLLKIEDILPFFPDFVTIDHFKVSPFFLFWHILNFAPLTKVTY